MNRSQRRSIHRSSHTTLRLLVGITIPVLLIVMALLPAPEPAQAQEQTGLDVWFAVVADPQLDWYEKDEKEKNAIKEGLKAVVTEINRLNGSPHPDDPDKEMEISGVVVVGDLTYGKSWDDWDEFVTFRNFFENALEVPMYVGLGNHDLHYTGRKDHEIFPRILNYLQARHYGPRAAVPVTNFDIGNDFRGSRSYSWDWEGLHLVQLHRFGGDNLTSGDDKTNGIEHFNHNSALPWLRDDLDRTSSPVILFQHYGWDEAGEIRTSAPSFNGWWTHCQAHALNQTLAGENVIAAFHGHAHTFSTSNWYFYANPYAHRDLQNHSVPIFTVTQAAGAEKDDDGEYKPKAGFALVRVTDTHLKVWKVDDTSDEVDLTDPDYSEPYNTSPPASDNEERRGFLAIGVPTEDVRGADDAGLVNVMYSSKRPMVFFIEVPGNQQWSQCDGTLDDYEEHDEFGKALAAGDFDGDGYVDLAVGVPGEDIDGKNKAGAINIIYRSDTGLHILAAADNLMVHQGFSGVAAGVAELDDAYGSALAAGDFDGNGVDDLAVGAPGEDGNAGAVSILYGSPTGITATGTVLIDQDTEGIRGDKEAGDRFGKALAAGYFNGDDYADLAVGVPHEDVGGKDDAGAINVLYGSPSGVTFAGNTIFHQNISGVDDDCERGDKFGAALAAGDLGGDGYDDLAVGVPGEDISDDDDAGAIHIFYGSSSGITSPPPFTGPEGWLLLVYDMFSQPQKQEYGTPGQGLAGKAEDDDQFGWALAIGEGSAPATGGITRTYLPVVLRGQTSSEATEFEPLPGLSGTAVGTGELPWWVVGISLIALALLVLGAYIRRRAGKDSTSSE